MYHLGGQGVNMKIVTDQLLGFAEISLGEIVAAEAGFSKQLQDQSDCFIPALIVVSAESVSESKEIYHINFLVTGLPRKIFGHQSEYFLEIRRCDQAKDFGQFDLIKRTKPESGTNLGSKFSKIIQNKWYLTNNWALLIILYNPNLKNCWFSDVNC